MLYPPGVPCIPQKQADDTYIRTVKIIGTPRPQFVPASFPGEGLSYTPSQRGGAASSGSALAPTGAATGGSGRGNGLQGGGDVEVARRREDDAKLVPSAFTIQETVRLFVRGSGVWVWVGVWVAGCGWVG